MSRFFFIAAGRLYTLFENNGFLKRRNCVKQLITVVTVPRRGGGGGGSSRLETPAFLRVGTALALGDILWSSVALRVGEFAKIQPARTRVCREWRMGRRNKGWAKDSSCP